MGEYAIHQRINTMIRDCNALRQESLGIKESFERIGTIDHERLRVLFDDTHTLRGFLRSFDKRVTALLERASHHRSPPDKDRHASIPRHIRGKATRAHRGDLEADRELTKVLAILERLDHADTKNVKRYLGMLNDEFIHLATTLKHLKATV